MGDDEGRTPLPLSRPLATSTASPCNGGNCVRQPDEDCDALAFSFSFRRLLLHTG